MVADLPGPSGELDAAHPRRRGLDQRHRPGHRAARPPPRHLAGAARARGAAACCAGAFSFVWMNEDTLYAARDPQGIRPLVLGRLERGWVVASEDAALATVGASVVREVEPGELIVIDENGLRSHRFAEPAPKGCVFEYVYLARPDATIAGRSVHEARVEMGRRLAREFPVDADLVMPVPESGTPAAAGYAEECGIPFGQGFVKNAYVGRTFIQPSQTLRQLGIRLKLNALEHMIRGKRLVVVDDSIVRGNTQRAQVRMLREAGALEVHVRISSPPVKWPCFYGIDFATRAELIANGLDVDEIARQRRRRQPRLHLARGHDRGHRPAGGPALPGLLHRRVPDRRCPTRACSASTCSRRRLASPTLGKRAARAQQPLIQEPDVTEPDRLRRRRRLDRGRRQGRRADEGLGREGPPARGDRRHRRLRRAVRRLAR